MAVAVFSDVTDAATRKSLERWAPAVEARFPWANTQFVTVTFGTANADHDIAHTLNVGGNANNIRWIVVSATSAAVIYRDGSATAKAWTANRIWLRASATGTVRLFLFTEATS